MAPILEIMSPKNNAIGDTHKNTITSKPPIISIGIIGTNKILVIGDAIEKTPEKYIVYGNINIGRPHAIINISLN